MKDRDYAPLILRLSCSALLGVMIYFSLNNVVIAGVGGGLLESMIYYSIK